MKADIVMAYQEPFIREYIQGILEARGISLERIRSRDGLCAIAVQNNLIIGLAKFQVSIKKISEIVNCEEDYTQRVLEYWRRRPSKHERVKTFNWGPSC